MLLVVAKVGDLPHPSAHATGGSCGTERNHPKIAGEEVRDQEGYREGGACRGG